MNKGKKLVAVTAECIKNPSKVIKGVKYLKNNGASSFKNMLSEQANFEYLASQSTGEMVQSNSYFSSRIKFSVLIPTYNVEKLWLEKAIESVRNQTYINWELCIVDDCSTLQETKDYLKNLPNEKIKVKFSETNGGISVATNMAAEMATGDYILLLDNDDEIALDAMYEFAKEILETDADIVYSDHDIVDMHGRRFNPFFKPSWSPDLMKCQMYVGHLLGFRKSLFDKVGGFNTEYNGSQDYDLFLRMCEHTDKISHIEKVLYSWRSLPSSTATNPESKPYAQIAGMNAVQKHCDRVYGEGKTRVDETENLFVYDVRYLMEKKPKVSVIIPTKDHIDLLQQLINSIVNITDYPDYELIILNNNSEQEESYRYFEKITAEYDNVFVHNVFMEFNWSYLNNYGMQVANGEVYIFLNNDTKVIYSDWMERLVENAVRDEVGVVGPMLLYDDYTIQHAGVVVGMNGWADHVFKDMKPEHIGTPFISPMVTRNVLAVTGACMVISKATIEKIGAFNDDFVICGSDVEICLRAHQAGLKNIYIPFVKLYHYESKSRDSYIPEVDFKMSEKCYSPYRGKDPFYNSQLNYYSCKPEIDWDKNPVYLPEKKMAEDALAPTDANHYYVPEVIDYTFRLVDYPRKRMNLLLPSVNPENVFGGISTALKFYEEVSDKLGFDKRIILVDCDPNDAARAKYSGEYTIVECEEDCLDKNQIVPYSNRFGRTIPVSKNDYFMETGWWTAYCLQKAYKILGEQEDITPNPIIYFIQDYEPGFYPWSSKYMLAVSTYKSPYKQIAIFNSTELMDYMKKLDYSFYKEYVFDPVFNGSLKTYFLENCAGKKIKKKKQVLIYGRPGTVRNAFELNVMALSQWIWMQPDIEEWEILSAGEHFNDISLGNGKLIKSLGKLTLEEYAKVLSESYVGISLMVSPHPSYPPLEMATYGVKVITNKYDNKDLKDFSSNIVSVDDVAPLTIAEKMVEICNAYSEEVEITEYNKDYVSDKTTFPFMDELVAGFLD